MPPVLVPLWAAFRRLSGRRGSNGFGALPIAWADIESFQRLAGVRFTPWEIEQIEMLDVLFLSDPITDKQSDG